MKKSILLLFTSLFILGMNAQSLKVPSTTDTKKAQSELSTQSSTLADQASIGNLIGELTNNISDEAFTDSFKKEKGDFIKKTNEVTDAAGASSALQSLQAGLLPMAMDAGWSKVKSSWLTNAKAANSVKNIAGITSQLESYVGDSFFKGSWASARPAWQAALNSMAK
jgi:hypothetical protein